MEVLSNPKIALMFPKVLVQFLLQLSPRRFLQLLLIRQRMVKTLLQWLRRTVLL
ncbi:unnamed protein product [Cylicostephanus goldi]|uniref:Uncharacterized protein n=1 Tax=Cylicostephanus goldi TaxID=71465 RepID=A0A3P7M0H6_CYLGO|nr:unnamed protein product [Cylicostephanus goldi]